MRDDVQHLLDRDYRSEVVDRVRENGNVLEADGITLRLADEFGFCYGVDRAVDYAFQTREKFPERRIHITGDMIHNASMNDRLREMGIEFLSQGFDGRPDEKFDFLGPEDVVILPAFGAPVAWVRKLKEKDCVVVDTTCGSDRKSTRLNSSHANISYAVFCLKKKKLTLTSSSSLRSLPAPS